MTAGEEVVGDQAKGDVVHMSLNRSHMFGCYKVGGGRLELQMGQTDSGVPLNDIYMRSAAAQTREVYINLMTRESSRGNGQQLNAGLRSEQKHQLGEHLQLQLMNVQDQPCTDTSVLPLSSWLEFSTFESVPPEIHKPLYKEFQNTCKRRNSAFRGWCVSMETLQEGVAGSLQLHRLWLQPGAQAQTNANPRTITKNRQNYLSPGHCWPQTWIKDVSPHMMMEDGI